MTSKLTRERIELIANFHRAMTLLPSHDEIEELARMALAAMDSEPVAENIRIADALEGLLWPNMALGNKAVIQAAIEAIRTYHSQPAPDVVGKLLAILDRHTVELGWGEKPITLAELVIARDGSDELNACRAAIAAATQEEK